MAQAAVAVVTDRQRILRRWVAAYVVILLGTLPLALPLWNSILRDSVGRFLTIPQIHLVEYAGLGWFADCYRRAGSRTSWGTLAILVGAVGAVGLVDELIQWVLPRRFFDWVDVGLNLTGGALGIALAEVVAWIRRGRQSSNA